MQIYTVFLFSLWASLPTLSSTLGASSAPRMLAPNDCPDGFIVVNSYAEPQALSDGWINKYPNNAYRCWVLDAGDMGAVQLHVTNLDLQPNKDTLSVFDISGFTVQTKSTTDQQLIATLSVVDPDADTILKSSGRYMFIVLRSNKSVRRTGFEGTFQTIASVNQGGDCWELVGKGTCADAQGAGGVSFVACDATNKCSLAQCQHQCQSSPRCTGVDFRKGTCHLYTSAIASFHKKKKTKCFRRVECNGTG